MRQLSELEIQKIDQWLKSLQIRYTEIYEEIKDHYYSSLESTPENDSDYIFEKLNRDFSIKQIKRMENMVSNFSKKEITRLQLESLKIWNYETDSLVTGILLLTCSLAISYQLGPYIFGAWIALLVLIVIIIILKREKNLLRFNVFPWNRGTVSVLNQIVYNRISFLIGAAVGSIMNIQNTDFTHLYWGSEFYTFGNFILITLLIYCLSFYRVISTLKVNTSA